MPRDTGNPQTDAQFEDGHVWNVIESRLVGQCERGTRVREANVVHQARSDRPVICERHFVVADRLVLIEPILRNRSRKDELLVVVQVAQSVVVIPGTVVGVEDHVVLALQ